MSGNHQVKNEFDEVELGTLESVDQAIAGLVPTPYDFVQVTFTDATKTVLDNIVYKLGGSGGTTVRTITAAYPAANIETYSAS